MICPCHVVVKPVQGTTGRPEGGLDNQSYLLKYELTRLATRREEAWARLQQVRAAAQQPAIL